MQRFKLFTFSGIKTVTRRELQNFLRERGYYSSSSCVSGELYCGNILIFKFNLIE